MDTQEERERRPVVVYGEDPEESDEPEEPIIATENPPPVASSAWVAPKLEERLIRISIKFKWSSLPYHPDDDDWINSIMNKWVSLGRELNTLKDFLLGKLRQWGNIGHVEYSFKFFPADKLCLCFERRWLEHISEEVTYCGYVIDEITEDDGTAFQG